MQIQEQIKDYFTLQPDTKRSDLEALHKRILKLFPKGKLWFLDGKDHKGKIVANPNIGYGLFTIKYADGKTKEFIKLVSAPTRQGFQFISWALTIKTIYQRLMQKQ
jgi:hypothetical protein